jgi:DNA-directed RNA polymerase subunit K/omega
MDQNYSQIVLDEKVDDYTNVYQDYDISNNITKNKMTKYEYTKILGMRAQQITMGAEPLIEISDDMKSAIEVAEEELRQRKTPYIVARKINSKKFDFWKVEDMVIEVI